jgi:hypothetical protein
MVKNEHYVPRFYLERFSKNERIYAYDFQKKKIISTNVRKIGSKNYFYDIDPNDLKEELSVFKEVMKITDDSFEKSIDDVQFIEKALSRLEDKAAIYFNEFEKDYSLIKDEEFLSILFLFMRTLSIRTMSFRSNLENIAQQTTDWLNSLGITNVKNYPVDKDPKYIAKVNQLNEIISLPRMYRKSIDFFDNYDLFVGINNTKLDFLLSDNPLLYFFLGFNDICFPVNSKLAIIIQAKSASPEFKICNLNPNKDGIIYLSEKEIMKYNILQHNTNARYLFGSEEMLNYHIKMIDFLNIIRNIKLNYF